jgi:hypothetical protein
MVQCSCSSTGGNVGLSFGEYIVDTDWTVLVACLAIVVGV